MYGENDDQYVILKLRVSKPVERADRPGQFETMLTHPSLTGSLVLAHGEDRNVLLGAVSIDPKEINPVGELIRTLRELSQ
jgi:hypothetical protein